LFSTIIQIVGLTTLSLGFGLIFVPAGVIVAGVALIVFGIAQQMGGK